MKTSFRKIHVLEPFSKSSGYDSQNQVQSNSIDVSKGLESLSTLNYIKRTSLDGPDRFPKARNTQNMGCCYWATRHNELHQNRSHCSWVFLSGNLQFHNKTPILIPLTPNSTPKLIHLITNIKKTFKSTTNIRL